MRTMDTDAPRAAFGPKTGYSGIPRLRAVLTARRYSALRLRENGLGGVEMAKPMQAGDLAGSAAAKMPIQGCPANPTVVFAASTPCLRLKNDHWGE